MWAPSRCSSAATIPCASTPTGWTSSAAPRCETRDGKLYNKATGAHVKALEVVHVFGNMADMARLTGIARRYGLVLIEDATEALGTRYTDGPFAGKYAGTIGGHRLLQLQRQQDHHHRRGAARWCPTTPDWLEHAKHLSTQAKTDLLQFLHDEVGYNYRMTNVQACLGLAQLERLEGLYRAQKGPVRPLRGPSGRRAGACASCPSAPGDVRPQPLVLQPLSEGFRPGTGDAVIESTAGPGHPDPAGVGADPRAGGLPAQRGVPPGQSRGLPPAHRQPALLHQPFPGRLRARLPGCAEPVTPREGDHPLIQVEELYLAPGRHRAGSPAQAGPDRPAHPVHRAPGAAGSRCHRRRHPQVFPARGARRTSRCSWLPTTTR